EFSTKSAALINGQNTREPTETDAVLSKQYDDNNEEDTTSDSFLDYANGITNAQDRYTRRQPRQQAMKSFLSDSQQQQKQQTASVHRLPRRPESYHDFVYDGPSASEEASRLPVFESPMATDRVEASPDVRLARLVARYAGEPPNNGGNPAYENSEALSDKLPEIADTPEVNTMVTSGGQYSAVSSSPTSSRIPVTEDTPRSAAAAARTVDPSIVERTKNALQQRMALVDSDGEIDDKGAEQENNGSQQYTELRRRFLAGPSAANANQRSAPVIGGNNGGAFAQMSAYSLQNQSVESLEHPNMGSQGTHSPDRSILSMMDISKDMQDFYSGALSNSKIMMEADQFNPFDNDADSDGRFGAGMINSFGDSINGDGIQSLNTQFDRLGAAKRETFGHSGAFDENEMFTPVDDADEMFGNRANSSNQTWSDIVRDHEQVFSDLLDSLDSKDLEDEEEEEFDPNKPPESLFASSSSIVAEISRRRGVAAKHHRSRKFSTWDGREATQDAMRVQEERFSANQPNPIEMLEKANSLGMSDNETEISGILPESEYSPVVNKPAAGVRSPQKNRKPTFRGRSNTGLTLGIAGNRNMQGGLAGYPVGPQTAPMNGGYGHRYAGYGNDEVQYKSRDAPPPTTPTTFISRDTRHGPSTRVLHQVPPFDLKDLPYPENHATSSKARIKTPSPKEKQNHHQNSLGFARNKRPVGPRALDNSRRAPPPPLSITQEEEANKLNKQAAFDFALAAPKDTGNVYASDDDTHGLGSLLQDTLSMSDVSRASRTPNSHFQALNRILGTPRGSQPQQLVGSPVRAARDRGSSRSSVLESTKTNYMPFQEPTVDISRLPHYRSIGLQSTANNGGGENKSALDAEQLDSWSQPQHHYQQMKGQVDGRVAMVSERALFDQMGYEDSEDEDEDEEIVGTVRYDSPTPSGGSLASLSISDIAMDSFAERMPARSRHRRGSTVASAAHSNSPKPRNSRNNSHSQTSAGQSKNEASGPTLRDIYDLLKKTVSNLDSQQNHSRAHSQLHASVLDGLQEMAETMSRDHLNSPSPTRPSNQPTDTFGGTLRSHITSVTNQASSIGEHVPRQLRTGYAAADGGFDEDLDVDAYQSYPALRPSAPTPRRGQIFSRFVSNLDESSVDEPPLATENPEIQRIRSETGHSRTRQYLQRYVSDSVVENYNPSVLQPAMRQQRPPTFSLSSAVNNAGQQKDEEQQEKLVPPASGPAEALEDLVRMLGQSGGLKEDSIPAPLAEKLLELVATLAKASAKSPSSSLPASASTAVQTENNAADGQIRAELLRLQKDILNKFDECRAEVDVLRNEVRQGSTVASFQSRESQQQQQQQQQKVGAAFDASVNPMDSVSMVEARRRHGDVGGRRVARSPLPGAESDVRPLHEMPNTARNQRRHMVQWLNSNQDASRHLPASPLALRDSLHSADDALFNSDDDCGYLPETAVADNGIDQGIDKTRQMGDDEEEDALSDTSTTVPEYVPRMAVRSPLDPAMINPASIPSRRQQQKMRAQNAARESLGAWTSSVDKDLLGARETLDSLRQRNSGSHNPQENKVDSSDEYDGFGGAMYSQAMARQLADTLAELQRVHRSHFHSLGTKSEAICCPVCASLEAQNHDPYLFGKHAMAYKSMSTRQLQGLLNAYVAAMEDEFSSRPKNKKKLSDRDTFGLSLKMDKSLPAYHSFTPTRHGKRGAQQQQQQQQQQRKLSGASSKAESDAQADIQATRVVIELLREELDALSRRYHRMVSEYHRLNPSNVSDQRKRRHMARELKDLVDLLDVKGEQIAVLAGLHQQSTAQSEILSGSKAEAIKKKRLPDGMRRRVFWDAGFDRDDVFDEKAESPSSAERAYRSARELQQALGDLY
ncbi:hypothetical protein FB639_000284, partial [Coemansia asiatica]